MTMLSIMIVWNITRWRRIFKISDRAKNETQKSDFQLRVNHSRNMGECHCLETHIPRNWDTLWPSECDDYALCKVCDDSFPLRIAEGMLSVTVLTSHEHGHIAELNKLLRRIRLLGHFSWLCRRLPIQKQ